MARYLTERGFTVHGIDLTPSNGGAGIDELAAQLAAFIESTFPSGSPLDLVGLSMGGLGLTLLRAATRRPRAGSWKTSAFTSTPSAGRHQIGARRAATLVPLNCFAKIARWSAEDQGTNAPIDILARAHG